MLQYLYCRNVFPGFREAMVAQGTNPFMGTCGTVSWQVVEIDIRLAEPSSGGKVY